MILLAWLACTPEEPVDTACDDAPVLSWEYPGEELLVEHCQSCHASTAVDRHDAPASVIFDTYDDVVLRKGLILAVLTADPPIMPPTLPIPDDDRELLISWLTCDVPG